MKLSKEEIDHLALLARVRMTEEEKERFSNQLSDILSYVGQLNEADTSNVPLTARVSDLANVMEEDKVRDCSISREDLLDNAPASQDGYIKVKAVLE